MISVYFSPEVELLIVTVVITVVLGFINNALRDKLVGKDALKEMKNKQAEMRALMKKTDKESRKKLEALNAELAEMSLNMMGKLMPLMLFSFVVLTAILLPILNQRYGSYNFPIVGSWIWYYFFVALITSFVLSLIMKKFGKG